MAFQKESWEVRRKIETGGRRHSSERRNAAAVRNFQVTLLLSSLFCLEIVVIHKEGGQKNTYEK